VDRVLEKVGLTDPCTPWLRCPWVEFYDSDALPSKICVYPPRWSAFHDNALADEDAVSSTIGLLVAVALCRCDETVILITRLRIGHSRMTHSYLLSRESQPVCDHCKCHLTVKHMLLECPSTAVIRHKYFSSTMLKELFSNVDARCILDFTK